MATFEEKCDVLIDYDRHCEACCYFDSCSRGVTGGPNGPSYPACADGLADLLDEDKVDEIYEELMEE